MVGLATFAAGPFTAVEDAFHGLYGVLDTAVGYTGGTTPHPSYREVCSGRGGHAEAVRVEFDPSRVSYDDLLEVFWTAHDPTARRAARHRSAIFCHSPAQLAAAVASRTRAETATGRPITTQVTRARAFFRAEDVHQQAFLRREPVAVT